MSSFIIVIIFISIALFLAATVMSAVWVYQDATQRGIQAWAWVLLVILSVSCIGLILYLLIGRKEQNIVCVSCNSITVPGEFCSICGEKIMEKPVEIKARKSLLITSITCIVLAFVCIVLSIVLTFTTNGFFFRYNYSGYKNTTNGPVRKMTDKSWGDSWELSFSEASDGVVFESDYNARTQPKTLFLDIECEGTVRLFVLSRGIAIIEIIGEGSYIFDMTIFQPGIITMEIMVIDASDFSAVLKVET